MANQGLTTLLQVGYAEVRLEVSLDVEVKDDGEKMVEGTTKQEKGK